MCCSIIVACKSKAINSTTDESIKEEKKEIQSPLAQRLYTNYHAEPANNDEQEENWIIEYAVKHNLDVIKSPTGLYYQIENVSSAAFYQLNSTATAHYRGTFFDGTEFDSSYSKNKPMTFTVSGMIAAWKEVLVKMNPGASATLLVPSKLAYGKRGFTGFIGPDTPLVFTIQCL